jgi:selenocysteine lyase/cysteine desulfurase
VGLLSWLNYLDWISPIVATVQDVNRDGRVLSVRQGRHSANDVQRILEREGIESWGVCFDGNQYTLSVSASNAKEARDILRRRGI